MRFAAAAVALFLTASCARAADPIAAEIARLETLAAAIEPAALHEEMRDMVDPARDRIKAAKNTRDPLLQLYRLRDAHVLTEILSWVATHRADYARLENFTALWEREKSRFERTRPSTIPHAVQNALSEAARNRAEKLFRASLPYAKVSSPFSGVYYLGEASANLSFAKFVESLRPMTDESRIRRATLPALASAAEQLETETLAFFANDPTARTAIPTSAKLKEARELITAGAIDGATLTLLETRLELARRQNDTTSTTTAPLEPNDSMSALWQSIAADDSTGTTRSFIHRSVLPLYDTLTRRRS